MDKDIDQQKDGIINEDIEKITIGQDGVQEPMDNDEETCNKANDMSPGINEEDMENRRKAADEDSYQDCQGHPLEDLSEEECNSSVKERLVRLYKDHRKIFIGVGISLCTLFIIYLGMAQFFTTRFYFGTIINGVRVSGKTVEEAEELMAAKLDSYILGLKERGGRMEEIRANEIGLRYGSRDELRKIQGSQNPYHWVVACFNRKEADKTIGYAFDASRLKRRMARLSCLDPHHVIEPKNPRFNYTNNNAYRVVDEIPGNMVDRDKLYSHLTGAILKGETQLDLEAAGCYIQPDYTSTSRRTLEIKDLLDRYVSTKITYDFGDRKETLEGGRIKDWISVSEDYEVELDQEKVKEYVKDLAKRFNTVGRIRKFKTSSGKTVKVGGGDYGWAIDQSKEVKYLISALKKGESTTREPEYSQTAFARGSYDIGNTYVEIHLAGQHLWFYKKGKLIVHGDIVTGNVSRNHTTPKGIYRLKYKAKNVVLRGPDYAAPVTFWMPFNGGIGMHDASWRGSFGGNIYRTNGSHGCINCPYHVAKAIYNNIEPNTPVICY